MNYPKLVITSKVTVRIGRGLILGLLTGIISAWAQPYDPPYPADAGIINVKASPYNAVGDGVADDTAALQKAFSAGAGECRFVYLPPGTYKVNKTLYARKQDSGRPSGWDDDGWGAGWRANTYIIGHSKETTIIKLENNLWPNPPSDLVTDFRPQSVLFFASETPDSTVKATGNKAFRNSVWNMTIDTGSGNAGAVGIDYLANNRGSIRNVRIRSSDPNKVGFVGLRMDRSWPGPSYVKNLEIIGFDYGLKYFDYQYGMTFEDLTLRNQKIQGVRSGNQSLNFHRLVSENSVPVLNIGGHSVMTLIGGHFTGGSPSNAAIINTSGGSVHLRNITASGYGGIVNQGGTLVGTTSLVQHISPATVSAFAGTSPDPLNLPIEDQPDLDFLPNPSTWTSVGLPNGVNDTVRIQNVLNSGASVIYFPQSGTTGTAAPYKIDATLTIPASVRYVFGAENLINRLSGFAGPTFEFLGSSTAQPLIIDRFRALSGTPTLRHNGSRTVYVRHVNLGGNAYTALPGAGKFFIDDSLGSKYTFSNGQRVWARQLNPEFQVNQVINDGGTFWVMGYKSEQSILGTEILTKNGGYTEVLGGLLYPLSSSTTASAFVLENAHGSFTIRRNSGNRYGNLVKETRGSTTLTVSDSSANRSLFTGYTEPYSRLIDIIPIARYDFNNVITSSDTDVNSSASTFNSGAGYQSVGYLSNTRVVNKAGSPGASAATNNTNGEYFKINLTPVVGKLLTLDTLTFQARRASSSPDKLTVYVIPTGGAASGQTFMALNNVAVGSSFSTFTVNVQDIAFEDLTNAEVRFIFHGNNQGSGSNYLDAVQMEGGTW